MKLLLDTHVLLWAAGRTRQLSSEARKLLGDEETTLLFSAASLWEIAIKSSLGRQDFRADPHLLRRGFIDNEWEELPVTSAHALAITHLPPLHRDPFDRLLLAQAEVEGVTLLTADATLAQYPCPVRLI